MDVDDAASVSEAHAASNFRFICVQWTASVV
jgi:hypothetical protein